jgi:hypothetical protein
VNASLLDVLHDSGDEDVLSVAKCVDVNFDGVGQITIDQHRALARHDDSFLHVALKRRRIVHDLHRPSAEHV